MFPVHKSISSGPNLVCSLLALLLIPSLVVSSMAITPEAGSAFVQVITGKTNSSNNSNGLGGIDLLAFMKMGTSDLSSLLATALIKGDGDNKTTRMGGRPSFDRIEIRPGNSSVLQGQTVNFTATAYRGTEAISGVRFRWSKSTVGINQPSLSIGNGQFRATRPGSYVIKASAEGSEAQAEITVIANPGNWCHAAASETGK